MRSVLRIDFAERFKAFPKALCLITGAGAGRNALGKCWVRTDGL